MDNIAPETESGEMAKTMSSKSAEKAAGSELPGPAAWAFGALSAALIAAASCAILGYFADWQRSAAYEEFVENVGRSNYQAASTSLDILIGDRGLEAAINLPAKLWKQESRPAFTRAQLRDLLSLFDLLRKGSLAEAAELYESTIWPWIYAFTSTAPSTSAVRPLPSTLRQDFSVIRDSASEQRARSAALTELQERRKGFAAQYLLVATDLADLLSLRTPDPRPDGKLEFYKSGVFTGLPALLQLRDGVEDLTALREALDQAGGKVKTQGDDPHAYFTSQLERLLSISKPLSEQAGQLERQEQEHTEKIAGLRTSMEALRVKVIRNLETLTYFVFKPEAA